MPEEKGLRIPIKADADEQQIKQEAKKAEKAINDNIKIEKMTLNFDKSELEKNLKQAIQNIAQAKAQGDKKLEFRAKLEAQQFINGIKNIDKEIDKLDQKTKAPWGFFSSVSNFFVGGAVALGVTNLWKKIIELWGNLEQAQISFSTMLWSAEKANDLLNQLNEFAKKTPFEIQGIRENAKQLLAMGVSAEEMIPTLKALGDVSAWLSVPLERLALNYGQVLTKGKLTWQELRDFTTAWVPLLDELSKNLGKSKNEITDMISKSQITAEDVKKAFKTMSDSWWKFADLMYEQSATLEGQRSNFMDTLSQMGEKIGLAVIPALSDMISSTSEATDNLDQMGNAWMSGSEMISRGILIVINGIRSLVLAIQTAWKFLWTLFNGIGTTASALFSDIINSAVNLLSAWKKVFSALGNNIKTWILKGVNSALWGLNGLLKWIKDKFDIDLWQIQLFDEWQIEDYTDDRELFNFDATKKAADEFSRYMGQTIDEIWKDWTWLGAQISKEFDNVNKIFSWKWKTGWWSWWGTWWGTWWGWWTSWSGKGSKNSAVEQKKKELQELRDLRIQEIQESEDDELTKNKKLLEVYDRYKDEMLKIDWKTNDELLKSTEEYIKDYNKQRLKSYQDEQKEGEKHIKNIEKIWEEIEKIWSKWTEYKDKALWNLREVNNELQELDKDFVEDTSDRYNDLLEKKRELLSDNSSIKDYAKRYSKETLQGMQESWTKELWEIDIKKILEYQDILKEIEFIEEKFAGEFKDKIVQTEKLTETEKKYQEYLEKRNTLLEQSKIYEAYSSQEDLGENALKMEDGVISYYDKEKEAFVEIQDFKNQEIARELLTQQEKLESEYQMKVEEQQQEYELMKQHSLEMMNIYQTDTANFQKELDKKKISVEKYVADVKRALASIPSSYRAYWWTLNKGVTLVWENGPEAIIARQSSYVQPRNAVSNNSTVYNNQSSLSIGGMNFGFNNIDEMLSELKTRMTYRQ